MNDFECVVAELSAKKKRKPNPETALQKSIVAALRAAGLWVVRVPGQGVLQHMGPGQATMKASEMAGFPDLLVLLPGGRAAWLEVKTAQGRLSPLQKSRIEELARAGFTAAVVRSPEEALASIAVCVGRAPSSA